MVLKALEDRFKNKAIIERYRVLSIAQAEIFQSHAFNLEIPLCIGFFLHSGALRATSTL